MSGRIRVIYSITQSKNGDEWCSGTTAIVRVQSSPAASSNSNQEEGEEGEMSRRFVGVV
jgi:hypothetical protein